jgi:hypothetical protein
MIIKLNESKDMKNHQKIKSFQKKVNNSIKSKKKFKKKENNFVK